LIDLKIIEQVKKRNNSAFKILYENSIAYVYSIVRLYVSNNSEHADVIQEIYARLFLSIQSFDERKGAFKYWLRKIVLNQCLLHYRQGKSPMRSITIENVPESVSSFEEQFDTLTKEEIENFLRKMPEGYRQVFLLSVIDEYSHKEISEMLNISIETSRSQLSRAKNWLRKNVLKKNKQATLNNEFV